ncbi:E3 ubiquitin-protein ligase rnf213-alpha [Astyanax mexicanus]|uniref:RING-type E3 ubiquitin transferase n=1 Tax=Astyanax mexicanus TaxID=7994 RepID=A0A8T2LFQ2_ASTMX|nr:E3 ubiquitin-protein ligase rnf213-alpha [Astyanax mexicanus]
MKCLECGSEVKESFKFCPECGFRLTVESGNGKSQGIPSHQGKEGENQSHDPPTTKGVSSEQSTQLPEDNVKKKVISGSNEKNPKKDCSGGTTESKRSDVGTDTPQDGASSSPTAANKDTPPKLLDTASQSTKSSLLDVQMSRGLESEYCGQSSKMTPGSKSSTSEALIQTPEEAGSVRHPACKEHMEKDMKSGSVQPECCGPTDNESFAVGVDVPQDGTSLSSTAANKDTAPEMLDTASQSTKSSLLTHGPSGDISLPQSQHSSASAELPSSQILSGTESEDLLSRGLKSEYSGQSFKMTPGTKSSTSEALFQTPEEAGSVKHPACKEHKEKDMKSGSVQPECAVTTNNESFVVCVDVPQDGSSLSSTAANEESTPKCLNTTSQSTQSSAPTHECSFQSQQPSVSTKLPSSQIIPGSDSKNLESHSQSGQSFKKTPDQTPAETGPVKCPPAKESVAANLTSISPNDDLKSAQITAIVDQNRVMSIPGATKAQEEAVTSEIQSSKTFTMPELQRSTQEVPDHKEMSHQDPINAETEKQNQKPPVPQQKEPLQGTNGKGEKQSNFSSEKMFGPHPTKERPANPQTDNVENKQQKNSKQKKMEHKEGNAHKQEINEQASSTEKPVKSASSDSDNKASIQEQSSKEKKDRQNQTSIPQQGPKCVTVFFHAILSKDFKLDPEKDFVTIRSGSLGNWNHDIVTMEVTGQIEHHGFVVHGKLEIPKSYVGRSVAYKYVVHKLGKNSLEYEHIYKEYAGSFVNHCLFIREDLLTQQDEWHQYDDIICARPPEGLKEWFKNKFVNMKPDLVNGRNIAGKEMLKTIFEILREWSNVNVRNFFAQLKQFFTTYSNPWVFEDTAKPWSSLHYGEHEVKKLIRGFIQEKISLFQTDNVFTSESLRAGVVLLLICKKYELQLDQEWIHKVGWLLRLPDLSKEEFCQCWIEFLQPLQGENVAHAVRTFCKTAIDNKAVSWIVILPLLHLLEKESKPFESNRLSTEQGLAVWAGLKGFKMHEDHLTNSQHTRALMKVMKANKYLLDIDQLLARSWVCALGLNYVGECTTMIPVDFLDVLTMLSFRLDSKGSYLDHNEKPIHQIEIYCNKIQDVTEKYPALSSCLENCALAAVNPLCQGDSEGALFEKLSQHDLSKFGKLISAIVLKAWPKNANEEYQDGEELVMKHLLKWSTAKKIFQLQGPTGKLIDQLSDAARERMAVASSAFCFVAESFIQGNITIKIMNLILQREDSFAELLKIDGLCEDGRCKDNRAVKNLLRKRREEVDNIYHEREMVECLLHACQDLQKHIKVDIADLEKKQQVIVEEMYLDDFMEVHQLDGVSSEVTGMVTYYNLCENTRPMARSLQALKDSYIFTTYWQTQAKKLSHVEQDDDETEPQFVTDAEPYSLELINTEIFEHCYSQYESLYTSLKNGTITFQVIDSVFDDFRGKYDKLIQDLETMCKINPRDNKRWIPGRIKQIQQYQDLHLAVEAAEVIAGVKEVLCPEGNFQILDSLLKFSTADIKEESLDRIDENLISAKEVLVDITKARRLCLQELSLRRHFVHWVKQALIDISQLKVFVDLATISAGENAMDVDRVACFHDAVLGYSSMLYGLNANSDFDAFRRALQKLWQVLESDKDITKKLRDTARHLDWLKTVKESHGSVELSSLSLATAINARGVYTISAPNQKKISMETALRLDVPEEHEEGQEIRCYSLEDVRDLQNKLMLMSGKAEQSDEVEHFTEVFDQVQRLAGIFLDLLFAGNPLFRQWEAKITCSDNSDSPAISMDFNLSSIEENITVEGTAVEQLPELCRKMDRYLSDWKKFMDKQRSDNYFLNYYTAEQIVYLCEQLSLKKCNEDLEDRALTMLSFINPKSATSSVWKTLNLIHADLIEENVSNGNSFMSKDSAENEEAGLRTLDIIWEKYFTDMKTFLPDTLDTPSFAKFLDRLANFVSDDYENEDQEEFMPLDPSERPVTRELPKGLVQGQPNLIVCPSEEVLASCIGVYSFSEYEPLPTYDEVLLCSADTTYEHVELFLRRCLSSGYMGKKIYSLLYADLLSYEVSYAVEQLFHKLHSLSKKDYKLVIICSLDREHAYMPSAFSQFKLHMVPREPLKRIQAYLSRHYTVSSEQASAAAVFKDKQSVGIVSSKRAGVGKSLYIQRLYEQLQASERPRSSNLKCIRLLESTVKENVILQSLLDTPNQNGLVIFHFDVTTMVQRGLHEFLFKLLVLGYLMDAKGRMWKRSSQHLYVIEMLQNASELPRFPKVDSKVPFTFTEIFPKVQCRPPKEVLELEIKVEDDPNFNIDDPLMDDECFRSEAYQRPYQYLKRFHENTDLDNFTFSGVEGSHKECLQMLFIYCGIVDPSWAELRNFAWFLNLQLQDCETSVFCDMAFVGDTLRGFRRFVVDFMVLMAKDFATPSLNISDQSPGRQKVDLMGANEEDLAPFRLRKSWESEPHPYIFFNEDHQSMTFIGFHLRENAQKGVDAIDPSTNKVIRNNIMTKQLYDGLRINRVPFNIRFDDLSRGEKIELLCSVLGVKWPSDPDETYQLTLDNILKMMAIHMRFRCGIPVIIMGETGCGKTRLIRFLCELQRTGTPTENMKLVKVHGGTTPDNIYAMVQEAESLATSNKKNHGLDSVLFFDEANTTEAISCIKEVLCDNTVQGHKLEPNSGLQVIAACNPYRKHSEAMIERLEGAGLGYVVKSDQTQDRLGSIPLRQLVYRVHALPPSMIPLVWDFGQLNDSTEKMYIHQIVRSIVQNNLVCEKYIKMMTDVLSECQGYMRKKKDECSFVSLRDVERCMQVFEWFYSNHRMFSEALEEFLKKQKRSKNAGKEIITDDKDPAEWALLMAVAVCYHSCLEKKKEFWTKPCKSFPNYNTPAKAMQEIYLMQDLFLHDVQLGGTIAKNKALKENVFMMIVCIELRIPLFLVGKPGSSKSLSKTLVADAMQGQAAHSELYKRLKQIHLTSYQCSPHSTAEGIINTFKQCARFQEGKNLKEYVSVVVLDEIGLAEDSPKMPLKTLHPLLEEGCIDDDPLPHKKVGFIGISNWALDPAKMNRGIFVSRGDPDQNELIQTAEGICSLDPMGLKHIKHLFRPLAVAYLKICKKQDKGFFGLRDYYSLIKMIFAVSKASNPSSEEIVHAVLRNFSGLDSVDTLKIFCKKLNIRIDSVNICTIDLVGQNINRYIQDEDCRYLLILTKNFAGLQILQQHFFSKNNLPEIIFGSSFPKDQEYTQVCKNINRVKICMETGQTVVLLNLQNLYESLYDALNQYYVYLGGQKYVDLGLGTHRVKCRVHEDFRLIVIEEKEVVYKQFPIPLINRLEKHFLDINSVLNNGEREIVNLLQEWVQQFVFSNNQQSSSHKYLATDVFIGYHSDTCSSVVLQVMDKQKNMFEEPDIQDRVLEEAKLVLLNCATPDSVVRLENSGLSDVEAQRLANTYFKIQKHHSLAEFIVSHVQQGHWNNCLFTEVTTFSRLLTAADVRQLQSSTGTYSIDLLSLRQFETELSFLKKIRQFLSTPSADKILLVQMDFGEDSISANILASARYSSMNEITRSKHVGDCRVYVYFITKLPRMEGGTSYIGFQGGHWTSVHIDDLRSSQDIVSDVQSLRNISICDLFEEFTKQTEGTYEELGVQDSEIDQSESEGFAPEREFDTTALLRSCVQSAVSMLRDLTDAGSLSTRRVDQLLTLLDNSDDEIKASFMEALKKRLHQLLKAREDSTDMPKNWVSREASNIEALQEGGTFKHTLWRRVQAVITPLLAHLISVIDRNCNLDLLVDSNCEDEVKNLWLLIFGNKSVLDIPYVQIGQNSEAQTILIQSHMSVGSTMSCTMPFSWRIKDLLDDLWVYTLEREGQTNKQFENVFKRTAIGEYFLNLDEKMQREFFQRYLQDFIALTMKVSSIGEQQLLCAALQSCVNELCRRRSRSLESELSLPLVHTAYHDFQKRLQNLSRMMSILPEVVFSLQGNRHVMDTPEMILDVCCALACVEHLEPHELNVDFQRQTWLKQVKRLQVPIELVCSEKSLKQYGERSREMVKSILTGWRRIFTFSLFVEHIQLGIEAQAERLKPLVMEHSRNLWKVLEKNSDMKQEKAFAAVIERLKSCKQGASDLIFKFGDQSCAICRLEPQDPVELPCNHVFCQPCIRKWLNPGQMYCALCTQPVPDDFELKVSEDVRASLHLNSQFRQRCNAFFIEVVSAVCFKDNCPPSRGVILHLLSFLMVEAKPPSLVKAQSQIHTKALSPFDEGMDRSPVVRSVVLKLLLRYSFDDVKEYLEQHLQTILQSRILDGDDKTELYTLYISCFEDAMFEKTELGSEAEQRRPLQEGRDFLHYFLHTGRVATEEVSIEALQQIARLRGCLDIAAQLLSKTLASGSLEKHQEEFLDTVMELCEKSQNDWYRVYLIRKLCSLQGVEVVQNMRKDAKFQWLFPEEILQQEETGGQMDQYLVYSKEYKTVREAVAKATMDGTVESIDEALGKCTCTPKRKAFYVLLALFREVTLSFRANSPLLHPRPEQQRTLEEFIHGSQYLLSREMKLFAEALVNNRLGGLSVHERRSNTEHILIELAVHLKAVLLCGSEQVLAPLVQLGLSPATMQAAFIPTMPEDMLAAAKKAIGFRWYTCPNGHHCVVDNCGRPVERGRCLECGAEVGGQNHTPVQGFTQAQNHGDRTQRGHILGNPQRRDNPETLDTKSLSLTPFTLVRMITHLTMLLGAAEEAQSQYIAQIIRPPVQDACEFLIRHLVKDLDQLGRAVGKGVDDTVTTVHLMLSWTLDPPQNVQWPAAYNNNLSTKEARNAWEQTMAQNVITPKLKKLENKLKKVSTCMREDSRVSSNPILKVKYGDPRIFLSSLPRQSVLHSSAVWSCREKGSLLSLTHIVEQNDGKDNFPLLWRFLQKEAEFRLVKFLPEILSLQRKLVKTYQNMPDLCSGTIREFIDKQCSESLRSWYETRIHYFLGSWNQLRASLATYEVNVPGDYCSVDLDESSELQVLVPRRQGAGLCATALLSYLVSLHNQLVSEAGKYTGEDSSYTVSLAELSELHVIRYEVDRDLLPLVLSNCQYSMERGRETLSEYDLPKIQQQLLTRFLQGKPKINLTGIPTLVSRQERNYENIFKDIREKVPQDPLTALSSSGLATDLQSLSDVCEALAAVEVSLGFLAMTGEDEHMTLQEYLETRLQMGSHTALHILKTLGRCCLKHCVAVWQLLTSLKSEHMLRLKRDPFSSVPKEYQQALGQEDKKLLIGFLSKSSVDAWLLEMHEFLLLKLKSQRGSDIFRPDWTLKETLAPYMESKNLDVPLDVEKTFPDQILLSQLVETWKFIVTYKTTAIKDQR